MLASLSQTIAPPNMCDTLLSIVKPRTAPATSRSCFNASTAAACFAPDPEPAPAFPSPTLVSESTCERHHHALITVSQQLTSRRGAPIKLISRSYYCGPSLVLHQLLGEYQIAKEYTSGDQIVRLLQRRQPVNTKAKTSLAFHNWRMHLCVRF